MTKGKETGAAAQKVLRELAELQPALFARAMFLCSGGEDAAWEVLQETNLFLCAHARDYDSSRASVKTWAWAVQERVRLRLAKEKALFREEASELLALFPAPEEPRPGLRIIALRKCASQLQKNERRLLREHYEKRRTLAELASENGTSEGAMKVRFHRLRKRLADCVLSLQCRLEKGEASVDEENLPEWSESPEDKARNLYVHALLLWEAARLRSEKPRFSAASLHKAAAFIALLGGSAAAAMIAVRTLSAPPVPEGKELAVSNEEKSMNAKSMMLSAMSAVFAANAGAVELSAGEVRTVSDMTAGYTATEDATLVFDVSGEETFSGTVSGAIHVIKLGGGTVTFANANTHTGGTVVSNGFVKVSAEDRLGANGVDLANGGVCFSESLTLDKTYSIAEDCTGRVAVVQGKTVTAPQNKLTQNNLGRILSKEGEGTLYCSTKVGPVSVPTTWIVLNGVWEQHDGDVFGGHASTTTNLCIDVREGATFSLTQGNHVPIGRLELTGGTFLAPKNGGWGNPTANTAFKGGVYVHPSATPSYIYCKDWGHLNHGTGNTQTEFFVDNGAVLQVDAKLCNGKNDGGTLTATRLVKTGGGELQLLEESSFTGGLELHGGKVVLANSSAAGLGEVIVSANTEVSVAAGTVANITGAITGDETLTLSGAGVLKLAQAPAANIAVNGGTLGASAWNTLSGENVNAASGNIAVEGFAASFAEIRTAYPNSGIVNLSANANVETIAAEGSVALGSVPGTTLAIGSITGATAVNVIGGGTTIIGNSSATPVAQAGSLLYYGDTDTAEIEYELAGGETSLLVPEGKSASVTFTLSENGTSATLRKTGEGKLTLSGGNSTTLGDIYVESGTLSVSSESELGAGSVYLCGGNLEVTRSITLLSHAIQFQTDAEIAVQSGATFASSNAWFKTSGKNLRKTGDGTLYLTEPYMPGATGRWTVAGGEMRVVGNIWGGHAAATTAELEVLSGAIFYCAEHLPLPTVILDGGTIWCDGQPFEKNKTDAMTTWRGFSFRNKVRVLSDSLIKADCCFMGQAYFEPVFDIAEGATLNLDTMLEKGFNSVADSRIAGSFSKTGKGTLALRQHCDIDGTISVEGGTLALQKGFSMSSSAKVVTSGDAIVALEDGVVLDADTSTVNALLTDADIWVDASSLALASGATVAELPNKGSAGGSFGAFRTGNIPVLPTYTASAINGKPAVTFNGSQGLFFDGFTNRTANMTYFFVSQWTSWTQTGGQGYWGGAISMSSVTASANDNNNAGAFHIEKMGAATHHVSFSNKNGGSWSLSPSAGVGVPMLETFEANANAITDVRYFSGADNSATKTVEHGSFDIDCMGLGIRLDPAGKATYESVGSADNRAFIGHVGELLVWKRVLTAEEKASVTAYLKAKWFGVSAEQTVPAAWLDKSSANISVAEGATAALASSGSLTKSGAGTLLVGDASTAAKVSVNEGTLALLPTNLLHKVAVWADPSDESAVTAEDGRVVSLRNKGGCGGVFVANDKSAISTPELSADINGRDCLVFDGNAALVLDSYENFTYDTRLQVFLVARFTGDSSVAGKGKWAGPYSFANREETTQEDHHQKSAMWELHEGSGKTVISVYNAGQFNNEIEVPAPVLSGTPFININFAGLRCRYFAFETAEGLAGDWTVVGGFNRYHSYTINRVQLGGRLRRNGEPIWYNKGHAENRMWIGSIGEMIVPSAPLTDAERASLLAYLRAKWFNKGEATSATVLTATAIAPAFDASTAVTMKQGTTLENGAATQPAASLAVEGSATIARSGVTSSANYAVLAVDGDVSLPANMTFEAKSLPENSADILTWQGELSGETAWIVHSEKNDASVTLKPNAYRLNRSRGTVIMLI